MNAVRRRKKADVQVKPEPSKRPAPKGAARQERTNSPVGHPVRGRHREQEDPPVDRRQDPSGEYRDACVRFCENLGYPFEEIWRKWGQFALLRQRELKIPQDAAEESAWMDVCAVYVKSGAEGES